MGVRGQPNQSIQKMPHTHSVFVPELSPVKLPQTCSRQTEIEIRKFSRKLTSISI